ncbi:FAD-binding protein [Streptomyces sp. NPDC007172]|uniref:FAD-binding protein n=1 Tax=Streptomyces sp. NPDC007172 TaxID=3364776 RepID=UPI00367C6C3E
MARLTRRRLLELSALSGGTAFLGGPAAAAAPGTTGPRSLGPVVLEPDDPRYTELTTRGYNGRFTGSPDVVHVVGSADQVVRAVDGAARVRGRVAVRSGGHCFENLVDDPAVRVLIDVSEMTAVTYDPDRRVFVVEAGARGPGGLLPRPPGAVRSLSLGRQWQDVDRAAFTSLLRAHGDWHRRHVGSGSSYGELSSGLTLGHRTNGQITVDASLDAA